MSDQEIEKLLSDPGNAWNDDLYPVCVACMEQELHDGVLQLTCKANGEVHKLDHAEAAVWSLADGQQSLRSVRKKYLQHSPEQISGAARDLDSAVNSLAAKKLLIFISNNDYNYPVDIDGFTHIVTTRGGLYLVNKDKYLQIAEGMFFGVCFDNKGNLVAFDFPHHESSVSYFPFSQAKRTDTREGRVRKLKIFDGKIHAPLTFINNLPNNCHYIQWQDNQLYVVNCENQAIETINPKNIRNQIPVFSGSYHHINTIALKNNHYWVVKCLGSNGSKVSSVGVFNTQWKQVSDLPLITKRAHDLYFEPDSSVDDPKFWTCDSTDGYLVRYPDGCRLKVRTEPGHGDATRGLDLFGDEWVVGSGFIKPYYRNKHQFRQRGIIQWLKKETGELSAALPLPETPCCILQLPKK